MTPTEIKAGDTVRLRCGNGPLMAVAVTYETTLPRPRPLEQGDELPPPPHWPSFRRRKETIGPITMARCIWWSGGNNTYPRTSDIPTAALEKVEFALPQVPKPADITPEQPSRLDRVMDEDVRGRMTDTSTPKPPWLQDLEAIAALVEAKPVRLPPLPRTEPEPEGPRPSRLDRVMDDDEEEP